jgi:hypothetical protein
MAVLTHVVGKSGNSKTGPVAATYRDRTSCPASCPAMPICYAKGRIESIARKYGTAEPSANIRALAVTIPHGGTFRVGVVGDFLTSDGTLDEAYVADIAYVAYMRPDITIIAYTHAWRTLTPDAFPFAVSASCDSPRDISDAVAAGWPTVATVADSAAFGRTVAGRKVVQCPAQTRGVTCDTCRLCARPNRAATIGFALHGIAAKSTANRAQYDAHADA